MAYTKAWLDELDLALSSLDDCKLECDGMTYAISLLLETAGISNGSFCGFTRDRTTGDVVMPHCWVELSGGVVIDYRLRMWLGDLDEIPHGVFLKTENPRFEYQGLPQRPPELDWAVLEVMTDGVINRVQIPRVEWLQ